MKPLHSETTRLSRCHCCQSKHSTSGARRQNSGKSAARQKAKRNIRRELDRGE